MLPLIADGRLTQTPPGTPAVATFEVTVQNNPIHLVNQAVFAVLGDPTVTLVDVRTVARIGMDPWSCPVTRPGHIPGRAQSADRKPAYPADE